MSAGRRPGVGLRHDTTGTALCAPYSLFPQETAWTSGVACLRSLMSGIVPVPSETVFVTNGSLCPGPLYSCNLKSFGDGDVGYPVLENPRLEVRYGCDDRERGVLDESDVWVWLREGWRVAVRGFPVVDRWSVVMGYFPSLGSSGSVVVVYDPCNDEVRSFPASDLGRMWRDRRDESGFCDYVLMRENPSVG